MTQDEKDLLLKDLCTRLPYGVKVEYNGEKYKIANVSICNETITIYGERGYPMEVEIKKVKPYLFPISSMTEWQDRELEILMKNSIESCGMLSPYDCLEMERFFNENYLDWRGLIPKGLANDATGLNIY